MPSFRKSSHYLRASLLPWRSSCTDSGGRASRRHSLYHVISATRDTTACNAIGDEAVHHGVWPAKSAWTPGSSTEGPKCTSQYSTRVNDIR